MIPVQFLPANRKGKSKKEVCREISENVIGWAAISLALTVTFMCNAQGTLDNANKRTSRYTLQIEQLRKSYPDAEVFKISSDEAKQCVGTNMANTRETEEVVRCLATQRTELKRFLNGLNLKNKK